jgi:hypothetical protein
VPSGIPIYIYIYRYIYSHDIYIYACQRVHDPIMSTCVSIKTCESNDSSAHHEVFGSDGLALPLRSGSFDAAICIAVLHHMSTIEHRLQILR